MEEGEEENYLVKLTYHVWVKAKDQEEAKTKAAETDLSKLDLMVVDVSYRLGGRVKKCQNI